MLLDVSDVTPLNLSEEKERALADPRYEPQFIYKKQPDPALLNCFGNPKPHFVKVAYTIVEKADKPFVVLDTSQLLDDVTMVAEVNAFLSTQHIDGFTVRLNPHQVSRCTVSSQTISLKQGMVIDRDQFDRMKRHELETHVLRRWNHRSNGLPSFSDADGRRTEEGLAGLHSHIFEAQPNYVKAALRYLAIEWGTTMGFRSIRENLRQFGLPDKKAVLIALRAKRGMSDTAKPGVFSKDLVYLEGAALVAGWLLDERNDPRDLYVGRLTLSEARCGAFAQHPHTLLPSFFADLQQYRKEIAHIVEYNQLPLEEIT
jgi:hypothetical protein